MSRKSDIAGASGKFSVTAGGTPLVGLALIPCQIDFVKVDSDGDGLHVSLSSMANSKGPASMSDTESELD